MSLIYGEQIQDNAHLTTANGGDIVGAVGHVCIVEGHETTQLEMSYWIVTPL